jgi:PhnB protein
VVDKLIGKTNIAYSLLNAAITIFMLMITLNPYLVFNGNCEAAFHFYAAVFGGEILYMGRYRDVPTTDQQTFPNALAEKIMHATLQINPAIVLMGNDVANADPSKSEIGNTFSLYISTETEQDAYRIFGELATDGKIILPIGPTFWSTHYGMVTDQFGIQWKITFDPNRIKTKHNSGYIKPNALI